VKEERKRKIEVKEVKKTQKDQIKGKKGVWCTYSWEGKKYNFRGGIIF
jgi:hypothetical protein